MKIIYSWGASEQVKPFVEADVKAWRNAGYDITSIDHRKELGGITRAWEPKKLDELYHNRDTTLLEFYDKIRELSKSHDVFMVNYENVYHPEFIKSLKNIYTVIVSGDDPDGSWRCSKPYVHAFNHAFAWGVYFDANSKITEKYLEWGAKRADRWPHGVNMRTYDQTLTIDDICYGKRNVDLVYVGGSGAKVGNLAKIKRSFPQMEIYGRGWAKRDVLAGIIRGKKISAFWDTYLSGLWDIKALPTSELVPLYQRTKIGINAHLSYGVANERLYQLPANGVMQICDCPEGLKEVFEIGKEVVTYNSTKEAIELIRYYLEHDYERKEIAVAGFKRVVKDYRRIYTFAQTIEKIKKGMIEDNFKVVTIDKDMP